MRLEVTKEIEEAAGQISAASDAVYEVKERANFQFLLGELQQQHPRKLAMTHELDGFVRNGSRCRKRGDHERIAY